MYLKPTESELYWETTVVYPDDTTETFRESFNLESQRPDKALVYYATGAKSWAVIRTYDAKDPFAEERIQEDMAAFFREPYGKQCTPDMCQIVPVTSFAKYELEIMGLEEKIKTFFEAFQIGPHQVRPNTICMVVHDEYGGNPCYWEYDDESEADIARRKALWDLWNTVNQK